MSTLEPNLKEYTLEEQARIGGQYLDLLEKKCFDEAEKLLPQIPIIPTLANNMKEDLGIDEVIKMGVNLSEAVKYYGHDWLKQ